MKHVPESKQAYEPSSHKLLLTIHQILAHLEQESSKMDELDVEQLSNELAKSLKLETSPALYFQKQDKIEDELIKAGIPR